MTFFARMWFLSILGFSLKKDNPNVFSHCLQGYVFNFKLEVLKKPCCTWNRQMIFLQCGSFNAPSNCYFGKKLITFGRAKCFSPVWVTPLLGAARWSELLLLLGGRVIKGGMISGCNFTTGTICKRARF